MGLFTEAALFGMQWQQSLLVRLQYIPFLIGGCVPYEEAWYVLDEKEGLQQQSQVV